MTVVGIKKDIFLSFKQEPIDESDDQGGPQAKIQKIDTNHHTDTLDGTNKRKVEKGRSAVDYQNTIPTLELINDNRNDDHEAVFIDEIKLTSLKKNLLDNKIHVNIYTGENRPDYHWATCFPRDAPCI